MNFSEDCFDVLLIDDEKLLSNGGEIEYSLRVQSTDLIIDLATNGFLMIALKALDDVFNFPACPFDDG
jgi:hypothetical protein